MVWLKASISFLLITFCLTIPSHAKASLNFNTRSIQVGGKTIKVWIADTEVKRTQGMMFKTTWPKNIGGMLFVFKEEGRRSFWMKNTLLPLSLGFFSSSGLLLEKANMDPPKSLAQVKIDRVLSLKPAKYVLEVPKGWFEKQNIEVGSKLRLL